MNERNRSRDRVRGSGQDNEWRKDWRNEPQDNQGSQDWQRRAQQDTWSSTSGDVNDGRGDPRSYGQRHELQGDQGYGREGGQRGFGQGVGPGGYGARDFSDRNRTERYSQSAYDQNRYGGRHEAQGSGGQNDWDHSYSGDQYGQRDYGDYGSRTRNFGGDAWDRSSAQGAQQYGGSSYRPQSQQQARLRVPKNYQRTDDRIREDVYEQIIGRQHIDADEVRVEVKDGKVTLTGQISDRQHKHEIEDLVDNLAGVKDVDNQLRVQRNETFPSSSGGEYGSSGSNENSATSSTSTSGRNQSAANNGARGTGAQR